MTNYEVVARWAIKYSDELRVTNYEVVAQRAIKRGCLKNFILRGRLQNAPTQRTLKVIDYHVYRLWQSFLPVRLVPHNRPCGSHLAPLVKCRDKKTARGDGAVLYEVITGLIFVFGSA